MTSALILMSTCPGSVTVVLFLVPVQNDGPFLPSDFLNSIFLLNNETLFEVSFSPVEVRLVFGTQSLFF
jgi:hypothetical protein